MTPLRRALHEVRAAAALEPARPAWAAGLRAAIATVVPLVVDALFGVGGGTWMSLAGFSNALADRGGPYRTRAVTMAVLTCAAAAAAALGTLGAVHAGLAAPLAFAVAVGCSLARVWGNAGAGVGGAALSTFVIALGLPVTHPAEALTRAGYVLIGGLWAMLVALVLWPLRPYRPGRLAVAEAWRALGDYASAAAGGAEVRAALEHSRAALAALRRGRPGETGRGEHLLVLDGVADQIFGNLLALTDTIDSVPPDARQDGVEVALRAALAGLAATARAIALGIEGERRGVAIGVDWNGDAVRNALAGMPPERAHEPHFGQAADIVDRLAQYARVGAAMVPVLNGAPPTRETAGLEPAAREPPETDASPDPLAPLRAALSGDSVVVRYALRMGIVTAVAVLLSAAFGLKRGYWVTLTATVILQPYTGATTRRALQRVLGTVLGGVLTAALGAVIHDPLAILPLSFVFTVACIALLPLNYAAFSVFLTPTFVLLAEAGTGDWHLAGTRIVNTLLGGALALLGARLLWPTPEWSRLPGYMAAALRANRDYLRLTVALFDDRSEAAGHRLRAARRDVGLAALNADESFQRLLGEHRGRTEDLTPVMTSLTYTRRIAGSIAALAVARHGAAAGDGRALVAFADVSGLAFDELADAVSAGRPLAPLAALDDVDGRATWSPAIRARVERISRQIETMHDAIARWGAADGVMPRAKSARSMSP